MTDDQQRDDDLPRHADFLNSLPPELLNKLLDGEAVLGDPDEGLRLIEMVKRDEEEFTALIEGIDDSHEIQQQMAHLRGVLINVNLMLMLMQMRWVEIVVANQPDDWGPGANPEE